MLKKKKAPKKIINNVPKKSPKKISTNSVAKPRRIPVARKPSGNPTRIIRIPKK